MSAVQPSAARVDLKSGSLSVLWNDNHLFVDFPVLISHEITCNPAFCSLTGPQVRFPFRIVDRQPSQCGFPGFDLSCNEKNQTILKLPSFRSFIVRSISYAAQVINVDPDFCGPERLAGTHIAYSPFVYTFSESYTFYNCSSHNVSSGISTMPMISFPCLGSVNHSVFAIKTSWSLYTYIPPSCKEITRIWIPNNGYGGISRGAKYGLILGVGIPGLVFLIGLANYIIGKVGNYNQDQRQNIELLSNAITRRPPSTTGLDRSTIESYPRTVLGENCELPKDHGTCAICLSDYKPKDAVRTIPECNHYFHADCIDEWLKLNVTCPVCRKSPQSSSLVTPSSSVSSSIPRGAKYGIIVAITPQPPSTTGLDRPTIESYPKILLGESCKLLNADATCTICLSDYKPKEEVRSIPDCNHYFHVDCIDEWLKLNATCPVCRNSPESSSLVTPCSSMSSNSSDTTNSSHTANQQYNFDMSFVHIAMYKNKSFYVIWV
ncbi:Zinc finger, RING/FYVE/PHD-type [Artemisia annua]|uniref:RING-type E3 ubiquitin transferase n=1 Tax=Artemisia annua TaxID=35608 RepID=A0A2U1LL50_ARTAN|nr:Zinc finger, RING/FYVE/PHD-type [Artemisia annua]